MFLLLHINKSGREAPLFSTNSYSASTADDYPDHFYERDPFILLADLERERKEKSISITYNQAINLPDRNTWESIFDAIVSSETF